MKTCPLAGYHYIPMRATCANFSLRHTLGDGENHFFSCAPPNIVRIAHFLSKLIHIKAIPSRAIQVASILYFRLLASEKSKRTIAPHSCRMRPCAIRRRGKIVSCGTKQEDAGPNSLKPKLKTANPQICAETRLCYPPLF